MMPANHGVPSVEGAPRPPARAARGSPPAYFVQHANSTPNTICRLSTPVPDSLASA
jgi:hypothetical protein